MMGHVTKLHACVPLLLSPVPRPGCVTWENLERERPTSGATSRGRTLLAKDFRYASGGRGGGHELAARKPGSRFRASSGASVHVTVSHGTLQPWFLEPRVLAPEELLLIPELLVVGLGSGEKTRNVVSA